MPAKKKTPVKRASGAREQIGPKGAKRYVRRDAGKFTKDQVTVSRSRSAEARQASRGKKAKTTVKKGRGDRGDVKK